VPALIWLGWFWRPLRGLMLGWRRCRCWPSGCTARPGGRPGARRHGVLLKYFLSSQSAILWMSMLFFMSTVFYWIGMLGSGRGPAGCAMELLGSRWPGWRGAWR
jgi:hypothetical protein